MQLAHFNRVRNREHRTRIVIFRPENHERKFRTKHHILPRSRGGTNANANLTEWWNDHHEAWHCLYGNKTPKEVLAFVKRLVRVLDR